MSENAYSDTDCTASVVVNIEKEFFAYSELWHSSKILFELAESQIAGFGYLYVSCATTIAFSYEAYLNHVGSDIFPELEWKHLERCRTLEKHQLVCEKLGIPYENMLGRRPMQTVKELLDLRNKIVHGKTEQVSILKTVDSEKYEKEFQRPLDPKWFEKLIHFYFIKYSHGRN